MMRKSSHSRLYQKLPPPPNLNPEYIRIWSGWNELGNKEVVREASSKGFYVNLAIRFLAMRKGINFDEAEQWFHDEVLKWAKELLERKQVHRASHILNNINLDANEELANMFCETENKELREYIGDHLLNSRKLDPLLKNCWVLFNGIQSDENLFLSLAEKHCSVNISGILSLHGDLKSNLAVALYFKNYDIFAKFGAQNYFPSVAMDNFTSVKKKHYCKRFVFAVDTQLEPFLNAECLWSYLVVNDKIEFIKLWIIVQYSENPLLEYSDKNFKPELLESLVKLFKKHTITDALIDSLSHENENVPLETKNVILNALSRYGVFNSVDSNNSLQLLKRLRNIRSVFKYKQVFQLETSSISVQSFHQELITYCLENGLESVVVSLFSVNDFERDVLLPLNETCNSLLCLLLSIREATVNVNDLKKLQANILSVSRYLNCDVFSYFNVHPIILVLLMLFDRDLNFIDAVEGDKVVICLDNVEINLSAMFESLSVLKAISDKFQNKIVVNPPTVWHLLSNHTALNTTSVTEFIQSIGSVPHFNSPNIVNLYGYKKTINTIYFLNQNQPSKACRMLLMDSAKSEGFNKESIYLKAERLALKNFADVNFSAATVAFLEMLGQSSKQLRIHLEVIKIIVAASGSSYVDENIRRFLQVKDNPKVIAGILENTIITSIQHLDAHKDLIEIFKKHEILIKFCTLHGLNLPERLLHWFAVNNLWLPFLIGAQIYNYPLHQIRQTVQNFKNPHLLEHINHSVLHNIDIDALTGKRNTRQSLYSKLGVRQSQKKSEDAMGTSTSSLSSYDSMCSINSSSDSWDPAESVILDMKATLLQALLRCHNSADPPKVLLQAAQHYRNPLLALLATSYEPDSVVTNWLVWLRVSCDIYDVAYDYETMASCPQTVINFLKQVVQHQYLKTLLESIEIFLPENPLRHFLIFLNDCVRFKFDSDSLKKSMDTFHKNIKYIRSNSIISETDHEITYLNNKVWIQKVALVLAITVLEYNFTSLIDQIYFVEALCAVDVNEILSINNRFCNLLNILKSVHKLNSDIKLDFSKIYDPAEYKIMLQNYLNILIEKLEFEEALAIAAMEGMNKDNILIEQFKSLATNRVDETFWFYCSETFREHSSIPETVIQFFQALSKEMEDVAYEKYVILKLAYKWAIESSYSKLDEIEQQMWVSFIHLHPNDKNRALEANFCVLLYADMKQDLESIKRIDTNVTTDNFAQNMDTAISALLDLGHYWEALKLAKMFVYKHGDLEILKLCSSVAEGLITVDNFNKEERLLLNSASGFACRSASLRSSKVSSTYSESGGGHLLCTAHEVDPVDQLSRDNLFTLQRLVEKLKSGYILGQNIFMMYRISVNIDIPYAVLLENDEDEKLLKNALDDECRNKLEVVHDFITVYKWSKVKVTDFICEELINTVGYYIKSKDANLLMWDINLDSDFNLILQLLQENCSLLGMKLFAYSKALHMSQSLESGELYRISEITLIVELLIRAHDCFTADCNMEGISIVLKKSQALIVLLLQLQSWKLIVRLLTGIRRYTEMEYVFEILRENEQFEFLLNRGSKKDNSLKLALLDYLKKYCPENRELFRMVALHFTLFSEVAHLWELEADSLIRNLISISKLEMENNGVDPTTEQFVWFSGTDGTKICLNKAMVNYSHAAQYHLQGEKLSKAMHAAKQAELMALQMSRVKSLSTSGSTVCLLHLNLTEINELLTKHLSFPQALIVIGAYDCKPDWANILYKQCVVNGDMNYLKQFKDNFLLSDHLVHEISRKFLNSKLESTATNNMKEMLMQIPSVLVKYKVASELGFSDILQDLLGEDKVAYLKDTVWKRGFRN